MADDKPQDTRYNPGAELQEEGTFEAMYNSVGGVDGVGGFFSDMGDSIHSIIAPMRQTQSGRRTLSWIGGLGGGLIAYTIADAFWPKASTPQGRLLKLVTIAAVVAGVAYAGGNFLANGRLTLGKFGQDDNPAPMATDTNSPEPQPNPSPEQEGPTVATINHFGEDADGKTRYDTEYRNDEGEISVVSPADGVIAAVSTDENGLSKITISHGGNVFSFIENVRLEEGTSLEGFELDRGEVIPRVQSQDGHYSVSTGIHSYGAIHMFNPEETFIADLIKDDEKQLDVIAQGHRVGAWEQIVPGQAPQTMVGFIGATTAEFDFRAALLGDAPEGNIKELLNEAVSEGMDQDRLAQILADTRTRRPDATTERTVNEAVTAAKELGLDVEVPVQSPEETPVAESEQPENPVTDTTDPDAILADADATIAAANAQLARMEDHPLTVPVGGEVINIVGSSITIDHGNGIYSRYMCADLDENAVKVGQQIEADTPIEGALVDGYSKGEVLMQDGDTAWKVREGLAAGDDRLDYKDLAGGDAASEQARTTALETSHQDAANQLAGADLFVFRRASGALWGETLQDYGLDDQGFIQTSLRTRMEPGSDIPARADGTVAYVGKDEVIIDHGNHVYSYYQGIEPGGVAVGDEVTQGQSISGLTSSEYLNHEVWTEFYNETTGEYDRAYAVNPRTVNVPEMAASEDNLMDRTIAKMDSVSFISDQLEAAGNTEHRYGPEAYIQPPMYWRFANDRDASPTRREFNSNAATVTESVDQAPDRDTVSPDRTAEREVGTAPVMGAG